MIFSPFLRTFCTSIVILVGFLFSQVTAGEIAVTDVVLSRTTADVTDRDAFVYFSFRLTSEGSGLVVVQASVVGDSGGSSTQTDLDSSKDILSGDRNDGVWGGRVPIERNSPAGTYALVLVVSDLGDNSGAWFGPGPGGSLPEGTPFPGAIQPAVHVTNANPEDTEAPQLVSLAWDASPADRSKGKTVRRISGTLSDDITGVETITLYLNNNDGQGDSLFAQADFTDAVVTGTSTAGTFAIPFDIPVTTAPGTYELRVRLKDFADNDAVFSGTTLPEGSATEIIVTESQIESIVPVLTNLTVTPREVDVSVGDATVTITAEVVDLESGFWSGSITYAPPSQSNHPDRRASIDLSQKTRVGGSWRNGRYSQEVTIPAQTRPGVWTFSGFALSDYSGNTTGWNVTSGDASPVPNAPTFRVKNMTGEDTEAPDVLTCSVDRTEIDLSTGEQTIEITLQITDDLSGVVSGTLSILPPPGPSRYFRTGFRTLRSVAFTDADIVSGTPQNGTIQVSITLAEDHPVGDSAIELFLSDRTGNTSHWSPANRSRPLPGCRTIKVTANRSDDFTPPEIESLTFTPEVVDLVDGAMDVTARVQFSDAGSGIEDIAVGFGSPNTDILDIQARSQLPDSGDWNSGFYEVVVTIPAETSPGMYAGGAFIRDRVGNVRRYGEYGGAWGGALGITVVNSGGNPSVPMTPYDNWVIAQGLLGGFAARSADPDHDGYTNLAELALGGDPYSPMTPSVVFEEVDGDFVFSIPVDSSAMEAGEGEPVRLEAEVSSDMITWESLPLIEDAGGGWRRAVVFGNAERRFVRVKATDPN